MKRKEETKERKPVGWKRLTPIEITKSRSLCLAPVLSDVNGKLLLRSLQVSVAEWLARLTAV